MFIAAFVALQLALPLSYYLGSGDPYDERFAWRMFSPTRLARCKLELHSANRPVSLTKVFHIAWIKTVERGRLNVAEGMAEHLCALGDDGYGPPVTARLVCRGIDGKIDVHADGSRDVCARRQGGLP